jgi:hypothetical protein
MFDSAMLHVGAAGGKMVAGLDYHIFVRRDRTFPETVSGA